MIRIVKLSIEDNSSSRFIEFISQHQEKIKNFEGCKSVEFLQDIQNPTIFFTYSHWESEVALELYRQSDLFRMIWGQVKQWFSDKPMAWSVDTLNL